VNPRRAMEQIVEYKNDPGNGYTKTPDDPLCLSSFVILNSSFDISERPYQVYAVQHMVKCIDDDAGNGFVWHTTGSGKTLTSFKASTLLKDNPDIHKCVFVVGRKDLDRQTREDWSSSDKTLSNEKARSVSAYSAKQCNRLQERCGENELMLPHSYPPAQLQRLQPRPPRHRQTGTPCMKKNAVANLLLTLNMKGNS